MRVLTEGEFGIEGRQLSGGCQEERQDAAAPRACEDRSTIVGTRLFLNHQFGYSAIANKR
jgi:hypothetical protein